MDALEQLAAWPARTAAAAVVHAGAVVARRGPTEAVLPLASVTKPLAAAAIWVALEERVVDLDDEAGPPGATVRHLLAHASGLPPEGPEPIAAPGARRIYSNEGFEVLARHLEQAGGVPWSTYLAETVLGPLGMAATRPEGSPAAGASSSVEDLARFAGELLRPGTVLDPSSVERARAVAFPGLEGVLPGFGAQRPNDWGLGVEVRGGKAPHWTGTANSERTYGHFGRSGTFLWVDPDADAALVVLTDEPFGPWAATAWPALADAVLGELGGRRGDQRG